MKSDDILKRTSDLLGAKAGEKEAMKAQLENERRLLVTSIGQNIAELIQPALENMIQANEGTINSIKQMLKEIRVEVPKTEVRMPTINVPRPQVNVSVPEFKMPALNIPAPQVNFPERMSVSMDTVNPKAPLPVMMMDSFGKPMSFSMGAGGGGKADFFTIKDIRTSTGASWFNDEGLRVSGSFSVTASNASTQAIDSSGDPYSQANPLPVTVVSGSSATTGSALVDSSGVQYSGSNPVPVVITSGAGATTAVQNLNADGTYRDTFPVQGTVAVSGITGSVGATILNGEGVARDTWGSSQVGTWNIGTVASITASTAVSLLGSDGLAFGTSKPVPVTMVTGVSSSVAANLHDSGGVGYSGSNPFPVTVVTSSIVSTIAVGSVAADAIDDGSAPVQSGGIARNANPTAVANGDVVKSTHDLVGRQLMRVNQVRNLLQTAYVTEDEIQEVTLLAGVSGVYHDLVYVLCANESTGAINLDFRQTTGGTIQMSVEVPANGTAGVSLPMPIPADHADATWTVKNSASDNSNTVYSVTGLFSKEV